MGIGRNEVLRSNVITNEEERETTEMETQCWINWKRLIRNIDPT